MAGTNVAMQLPTSSAQIASSRSLRATRSVAKASRSVMRTNAVAAPEAKAPAGPHIMVRGQVTHSILPERLELIKGMDDFAEKEILPLLKPVDKLWQPQDFLPHPESPEFTDAVSLLLHIFNFNPCACVYLLLSP